ncbi:MAG: OmpA family protein [Proteobacteria bacterium]|nr:OmpA family protein [Pseudomonadota bacterium]
MKMNHALVFASCALFFGACAATAPRELVNARKAYRRASRGRAARVAPAELHVANRALAQAEQSFQQAPDSYQTRDLAYVAQRKSEFAEATASIAVERKAQASAKRDYQATQGKIVKQTQQHLSDTRSALAASQRSGATTAAQLAASQTARAAADQRAADALSALARLAAVKDEPRGLVITLSGSVLFASNQATLLATARSRVDQVAAVLLTTRERNITVEGHTDSQGSEGRNLDLSQRRADAVRNALVQQGYQADLIQSQGLGETHPVADNSSAEGRANNRRVEIIIAPAAQHSSIQ